MIYVRDLLKLDTFKDFELVSGENGLDRGVSWPNVAQTVSIREWLVGGDVILMSGVGLKITDEFLTDIVIQAADGRAAVLLLLINRAYSINSTGCDRRGCEKRLCGFCGTVGDKAFKGYRKCIYACIQ